MIGGAASVVDADIERTGFATYLRSRHEGLAETLEPDLRLRSDHASLRIDLNWGRGAATLGSGGRRSPFFMPDWLPETTDPRHIAAWRPLLRHWSPRWS